jgi:hypothetical protein
MLWISCNCFDYLVITLLCFDYLVHVAIFTTLGQRWLASTQSSWRGRPKTAMEGLLLPRATPLLLPHATRWEAPAASALLHLPRVCRSYKAPTAATLLLLPPLTRMTQWRYHLTPPTPHPTCVEECPTSKRWGHMNTASRFQLFSIITKCICSFSDSKVEGQIGLSRKNFSRRRRHWLIISMLEGRRRTRGTKMPARRRRRAKALRMSGLEGSSPPRVVQRPFPSC